MTLRKRKSWTIIDLFYVPLEFQPKMNNLIYHHSTGFLYYTSVLSNSAILLGLTNAPRHLFKLLTCFLSAVKGGLQSQCDTSYSRGGGNQMWILKNSKNLLEYKQSRSLSSCNNIKTYYNYSSLLAEGQIKGVGPTVFHKKEWPT